MPQSSLLPSEHGPMRFVASSGHAKGQLAAFLPRAGKAYSSQRNYDFGPEKRSNVSCLSPYLNHRLLTEEAVLRATLQRHNSVSAEKFIAEVFWRGYFKGWLEHHPSVWDDYARQVPLLRDQIAGNSGLTKAYTEAIEGRTGIDCLDAWSHELVRYGYLHNHARMWFASIWIFTLNLPWQLGADFFLTHLLDGDAASNTCSWRWVGGLHTNGKNYIARADNITSYTNGRFQPAGLNERGKPLREETIYSHQMLNLPAMILPGADFALLLHGEECTAQSLPLQGKVPRLLLGLTPPQDALPHWTPAKRVQSFGEKAIADALTQSARHFSAPSATADSPEALIAAMHQAGLTNLVVPLIATGALKDIWQGWHQPLADAGITVHMIVRDYDRAVWPHAARGFFKLKQNIPAILAELRLA